MSKELQVVKSGTFEGTQFDCYWNGQDSENWYGTRDQIGRLLGYEDPARSIANIHNRNKDRLDRFSTVIKLITVEGDRSVTRNVIVYSFKGLLEICRYSNQPKADAVMDFLWNMADEVRKTGSYTVAGKDGDRLDLQRKRLDIMGDNARLRKVKALQEMVRNPKYPLTEESRQVLCAEAAALLTGHSVPAMLPDAVEKLCSNTDIAGNLGTSNRKVMKLGRDLGLVAPEGEGNEFGTWKMSKSPYSPHECSQWYWSEAGREKIVSNYSKPAA